MYIAPSCGEPLPNINLYFKLIVRRFEVVFWYLESVEYECCTFWKIDENSFKSTNTIPGPRHCFTKCALENILLYLNCWSWFHFSQEKLPCTTMIPAIAFTYCGKYAIPFFLCHPVYLDSDCTNFKTFEFLAVSWSIWTSSYNMDIKVQQFFLNRASTMLNNVFNLSFPPSTHEKVCYGYVS